MCPRAYVAHIHLQRVKRVGPRSLVDRPFIFIRYCFSDPISTYCLPKWAIHIYFQVETNGPARLNILRKGMKLINAAIGPYNELRSIIIIGLSDIEAFLIIIAWFAFTERKQKRSSSNSQSRLAGVVWSASTESFVKNMWKYLS